MSVRSPLPFGVQSVPYLHAWRRIDDVALEVVSIAFRRSVSSLPETEYKTLIAALTVSIAFRRSVSSLLGQAHLRQFEKLDC